MKKIQFHVRVAGYPHGKKYLMSLTTEDESQTIKTIQKTRMKEIESLVDNGPIHSIVGYSTLLYAHGVHLPKTVPIEKITVEDMTKIELNTDGKDKKVKVRRIIALKEDDLARLTTKELKKLKDIVDGILFVKEHGGTRKDYEFYKANKDIMTIEESKKYAKEEASNDPYRYKKDKIRKNLKKVIADDKV